MLSELSQQLHQGVVNQAPDIGGKITIAFLTILIPLAIAVLQDFFAKKSEDDPLPFAKFDLHVILDHVVRVRSLLIFASIPYLAQLIWDSLSLSLKTVASIFLALALTNLWIIIIDLYHWSKDKREKYRIAYLKSDIPDDELLVIWESIWSEKMNDFRLEQTYFGVFAEIITNRLNKPEDRSETDARLLEIMRDHLNQRSFLFLDMGDFIEHILKWHRFVDRNEAKRRDEKVDVHDWHRYDYPRRVISEIFDNTVKRVITSPAVHVGYIFTVIGKHADQHKDDLTYLESLVTETLQATLAGLEELRKERKFGTTEVLRALPNGWHVTSKQWKEKDPYAFIVWKVFFDWIQDRIYQSKPEFDGVAEGVLEYFFPKSEPITLGKLLHFSFLSYGSRDISEIIRAPRSFGLTGRIVSGDAGEVEQKYQEQLEVQIEEACTLIRLLFPQTYTDEKIRDYLRQLKEMDPTDQQEKDSIAGWIAIFEHMLDGGD